MNYNLINNYESFGLYVTTYLSLNILKCISKVFYLDKVFRDFYCLKKKNT